MVVSPMADSRLSYKSNRRNRPSQIVTFGNPTRYLAAVRTVTLVPEATDCLLRNPERGDKMKKSIIDHDDARDASLRVSKRVRDSLKAAAAVMGRPLYDVTNEAINNYLSGLKLGDPLAALRRGRSRKVA
jgi:hypothetical protein